MDPLAAAIKKLKGEIIEEGEGELEGGDGKEEDPDKVSKALMSNPRIAKMRALKLKMNRARKLNLKAVIEEDRKNNNPNYLKSLKMKRKAEYQKKREEELNFKGIKNKASAYLDKPAFAARNGKKKPKSGVFGWEVFNQDSLYKAYDKRCANLPFYPETYQA